MMLRYQFGEEEAAAQIEKAVNDALTRGTARVISCPTGAPNRLQQDG